MLDRLGHVNHDIDNAMRKVSFHITGFTPSQAHTDPNHNGPSSCRTPAGCTAGSFPSVASPPSMAVSPPSVCPSPSTCVLQSCTASVSKYNLCASPSLPLASCPFPSVSNSVLAFASTVGLGLPRNTAPVQLLVVPCLATDRCDLHHLVSGNLDDHGGKGSCSEADGADCAVKAFRGFAEVEGGDPANGSGAEVLY